MVVLSAVLQRIGIVQSGEKSTSAKGGQSGAMQHARALWRRHWNASSVILAYR